MVSANHGKGILPITAWLSLAVLEALLTIGDRLKVQESTGTKGNVAFPPFVIE